MGDEGEWALVFSVGGNHDQHDPAQALVRISKGRMVASDVPTRQSNGMTIPRAITAQEIETSARA